MRKSMNNAMQATAVEPLRVSQIESEINSLQVNIEDLPNVIAVLEGKLSSVMRPIAPGKGETAPAAPRPLLVPLAEHLNRMNDQLRNAVDRLREINGAVELTSS